MTDTTLTQLLPYIFLLIAGAAAWLNKRAAKESADASLSEADARNRALMNRFADEYVRTLKEENAGLRRELREESTECDKKIHAIKSEMQQQIDELNARLDTRESDGK